MPFTLPETMAREIFMDQTSGIVSVSLVQVGEARSKINMECEYLVIERDFRLTGEYRKQTDKATAPEEFKTNSWWKVSPSFVLILVYNPRPC